MTIETSKGVLLERYFNRRAESSIAKTPFFKLSAVQFGYGFLDTSTNPALVTDIPLTATKADITNVYIDQKPTFTYDASSPKKVIKMRAEIPAGAQTIPTSGVNVNVACVLDESGDAVGMLAGQLSVVNKERGYIVTGEFEINLS